MVRKERLELSRVTPLEPKSSASTNSATFARFATVAPKNQIFITCKLRYPVKFLKQHNSNDAKKVDIRNAGNTLRATPSDIVQYQVNFARHS